MKSLVEIFSYNALERECVKQDWIIPSYLDVVEYDGVIKHDEFWVKDVPFELKNPETHVFLYNLRTKKLHEVNKTHNRYNAVVIKIPRLCVNCKYKIKIADKMVCSSPNSLEYRSTGRYPFTYDAYGCVNFKLNKNMNHG